MKKLFFVFVFAAVCVTTSVAQFSNFSDTSKIHGMVGGTPTTIHFNVEAGTQIGFGKSTGASVFVAPRISFPINNRLTVGGGIIYQHSIVPTFFNSELPTTFSQNKYQIGIFASGDYKLSDRVSVNGTYRHGLFPMQNYQCGFGTMQYVKLNTDTYSLGLDYKLSEHASSIGIQVGNNPFPMIR